MAEEVYPHIHKLTIPLPKNPLKALNAYLIKGDKRHLLIDTGFNQPECQEAMEKELAELGIEKDSFDIFITHLHGDHSGLVGSLVLENTKVFASQYCADSLTKKATGAKNRFYDFVIQSGLADMGLTPEDSSIHPGVRYAARKIEKAQVIQDGEAIKIGDFKLFCIHTIGHTPGHMCLYEPHHKLLFSGDHILGKITPNIAIWGNPWTIDFDYLGEYLKSLDKVAQLEVKLVLPGHRHLLCDSRRRISELKVHHHQRLEHVLEKLGDEKLSGAQVASRMNWDLSYSSWDKFPPAQKFFATGEALSHLTHLVFSGLLQKELAQEVVYYARR